MGLFVGNRRVAPVVRVNVTPNFKGVFNLVTDLGLNIGATESQIATALATEITTAVQYDYCLVDIPDYQVYNGYSAFASVDDYVDYYVIYNNAYELVTNANKSSLGIVPKTTVAYILNNAYSVVRYNFDGTDWTSADNSGYANVDASNFTSEGTTFISNLGFPDSLRYESLSIGASGTTYTSPANGWILAHFTTSGLNANIVIRFYNNTSLIIRNITWCYPTNSAITNMVPVSKGDIVMINYTNVNISATNSKLYFLYAEGNPTLPQS